MQADIIEDIKKRLKELKKTFDIAVTLPVNRDVRAVVPHLIFTLGKERFGMPSTHVREIVVNYKIVRLPGNNGDLCGVINYRNAVLSVLDLGTLLKAASKEKQPGNILIITKGLTVNTAFLVDSLAGFAAVKEKQIQPKPFSMDPAIGKLIKGEYFHQDQMVTLLNPGCLEG